jgi:hypothetical protein
LPGRWLACQSKRECESFPELKEKNHLHKKRFEGNIYHLRSPEQKEDIRFVPEIGLQKMEMTDLTDTVLYILEV